MKIILNPYQDPAQGRDWHQQTPEIETRINGILQGYEQSVDYSMQEVNLGAGADWPAIALNVSAIAGIGFFAIPEAHKRVREALEEWERIGAHGRKFMNWISGKESVVALPIDFLFEPASKALLKSAKVEDATFIKYKEIAPIGSNEEISGLYEFRFDIDGQSWRVLITGKSAIRAIEKI